MLSKLCIFPLRESTYYLFNDAQPVYKFKIVGTDKKWENIWFTIHIFFFLQLKILLYNGVCGPRLSCLNSLTAILSMTGYAAVVDIHRDGTAQVNSIPVDLPYVSPCGSIFIAKVNLTGKQGLN